MINKLSVLVLCTFFMACADADSKSDAVTQEFLTEEISQLEIQQILNELERSDEDREALRDQLEALWDDCENGDEEACLELRELMAELESEREGDSEEECEEGDTAERGDVTYECVDGEWVIQE